MAGDDAQETEEREGTVLEALPSGMYTVEIDGGHKVTAHVARETRMTIVRILPGDRVRVAVSMYDGSRGRIVRRLK